MPSNGFYSRVPTSDHVEPFDRSPTDSSYPPRPRAAAPVVIAPSPPFTTADLPYSTAFTTAAKGKARAFPLDHDDGGDDDASPTTTPPTGLSFCVRFTDGTTEDILDLYVTDRETVRDVKRRLRLIRPNSLQDAQQRPRRLRLIQLGRMLPDGVLLVPYELQLAENRRKLEQATTSRDEGIVDKVGSFVKGAVNRTSFDAAERGEGPGVVDRKGKGKEMHTQEAVEQIWLHCSVGDVIEDEEVTTELPTDEQQTTPLQGFDRLREAGFSEEEIENMRAEFRERRGVQEDADDAEHQRALEEQWLSGMTGQGEAAGDSTGTGHYVTLLKGVCVGFFMPFLPLFFFRTQIFSRRMQMAIVLGILINLSYGLLRLLG